MKQVVQKPFIGILAGIALNRKRVIKKRSVSQASLELAVALIGVAIFFVGIIRIWVWSNSTIIHRTPAYNSTRVASGSSNPGFWKVYTPKELTDNWVFKGDASSGSAAVEHKPGAPTNVPFAGWCVGGDCSEASANHVGVAGYDWDFSVDLTGVDLTDCSQIKDALDRVNKALSDASDQLPIVQKWLHYWSDRLAQANAAGAGGNVNGYATARFQYNCGWWDDPNWQTCHARKSPCVSGCTLSCDVLCPVYGEYGYIMTYEHHPFSITVSSGFSNRAQMAKDYYKWDIVNSGKSYGLTDNSPLNYRARSWLWWRQQGYKWYDNLYGGGGYGLQSFQYHPGLRDFQARANYAQSKVNDFHNAYNNIEAGIKELNKQKSMLEADFNNAGCS